MDEAKLTQKEVEELKDTIVFRVKTTEILKTLAKAIDKINSLPTKVALIESKTLTNRTLIFLIITGILGLAVKTFAR